MKEMVDRLLDGKAVELTRENASFYLSVLKREEGYKIRLVFPEKLETHGYSYFTPRIMKEAGNLLIELAEELESRTKFKDEDDLFFVTPEGVVLYFSFDSKSASHLGLVMSGNAFKTRAEAEEHKEEVMAKYQELRDKGLV